MRYAYLHEAVAAAVRRKYPQLMRISANVTGDFGNVTDFDRLLGCAGKIVGIELV